MFKSIPSEDAIISDHSPRRNVGAEQRLRIAARVIESAVAKPPLTMRALVKTTKPFRRFPDTQPAAST